MTLRVTFQRTFSCPPNSPRCHLLIIVHMIQDMQYQRLQKKFLNLKQIWVSEVCFHLFSHIKWAHDPVDNDPRIWSGERQHFKVYLNFTYKGMCDDFTVGASKSVTSIPQLQFKSQKIDDGPFLWKEINGYVGTEDECTGYNGMQCTGWLWNNEVAPAQKRMTPKAGSQTIKISADEVIRRLFAEMAHCEWIIDQLWLLFEMGLCECQASSCATSEITTSAVGARAHAGLLTCPWTSPGGLFLWMTTPQQTVLVPSS